eukprot:TRINITY_DN19353_c0_g2_i2.p1 TRINITY_DN19353_c0_g2~~TRINITY_DN19353_c0_g2_i2.p1  ORF type:complete len:230 (-),score=13.12 TRINITY_DN19353_c0_g2_i2:68-757(-)
MMLGIVTNISNSSYTSLKTTRISRPLSVKALNPAQTAVVLIEFQNDFVSPGGTLHEAVKDVMQSTNMLQNACSLVEKMREKGALIVHAPIVFSDDYRELAPEPYGILANVKKTNSFKASQWGGAIVDSLSPTGSDVKIEGKRGLDGFESTNLDFILRARGITHIGLAGFLTNCCVESTMRTAYEKGYKVYTLIDCCATTSQEAQNASISNTYPMFSIPVNHQEFQELFD